MEATTSAVFIQDFTNSNNFINFFTSWVEFLSVALVLIILGIYILVAYKLFTPK